MLVSVYQSSTFSPSLCLQDDNAFTNQTLSENPLNEDPPQSLSEYIASLNVSVMEYVQMVEIYQQQANNTIASNMLGDAALNAVSVIA